MGALGKAGKNVSCKANRNRNLNLTVHRWLHEELSGKHSVGDSFAE